MKLRALAAQACLAIAACASAPASPDHAAPTPASSQASLYDRLGGLPAIKAVVTDFVQNVAGDERINARFATTDIPNLQQKLIDQICQATGGPCVYKGKDMKTVHRGMNLTNADFDALCGDLQKSLDKFKVGPREQGELMAALGSMRSQIVNNGNPVNGA